MSDDEKPTITMKQMTEMLSKASAVMSHAMSEACYMGIRAGQSDEYGKTDMSGPTEEARELVGGIVEHVLHRANMRTVGDAIKAAGGSKNNIEEMAKAIGMKTADLIKALEDCGALEEVESDRMDKVTSSDEEEKPPSDKASTAPNPFASLFPTETKH